MLMGIRKMGFALNFPFIEDRISSVRRVRLSRLVLNVTQWGDIEWHCLHYLKGGTGEGVKRHNRPTRGPYKLYKGTGSVCTAPALYNVGHEGTVSAAEYRHLRTPPSSAPPATEPETSKHQWWKIFFLVKIWQILWHHRDTIFVLYQMNSLNWRVIWLWVCFKTLEWISFFAH